MNPTDMRATRAPIRTRSETQPPDWELESAYDSSKAHRDFATESQVPAAPASHSVEVQKMGEAVDEAEYE